MAEKEFHVLFLSRRNSARSLMAEAILNKLGGGRFHAMSAGVQPASSIDPYTRQLLQESGLDTSGMRPRHYREFAAADAKNLDFVFTLSDTAAGEPMPEWPGLPITAHWSFADPVLVEGQEWEKRAAFRAALSGLERRIAIFVNLPFKSLDRMSLQKHVEEIAKA